MTKPSKAEPEVYDLSKRPRRGELKAVGGSMSDEWNSVIVNQAVRSLWRFKSWGDDEKKRQRLAVVEALIGIEPKDELEGMIAAQLIACHNASMECYRRAMLPEQTFEGHRENLNQANKLSRTYSGLLETLDRHRGKGQQKVTVEHVHVHQGGQAIVGTVEGGGIAAKTKDQPHALAYAPGTPVRSADTARKAVPVTGHEERPVPDARRPLDGSTEGQS